MPLLAPSTCLNNSIWSPLWPQEVCGLSWDYLLQLRKLGNAEARWGVPSLVLFFSCLKWYRNWPGQGSSTGERYAFLVLFWCPEDNGPHPHLWGIADAIWKMAGWNSWQLLTFIFGNTLLLFFPLSLLFLFWTWSFYKTYRFVSNLNFQDSEETRTLIHFCCGEYEVM